MKYPLIDEYISEFEELARKAGYSVDHNETPQLFYKGLPSNVLVKVVEKDPQTYNQLKRYAIQVV